MSNINYAKNVIGPMKFANIWVKIGYGTESKIRRFDLKCTRPKMCGLHNHQTQN